MRKVMIESGEDVALWHVSPRCVGSASIDPALDDDEELWETVWVAAHEADPVHEWIDLSVSTDRPTPSSVLYVEEAEVLVYAEPVRSAVEGVRTPASDHVWLPLTVVANGSELRYWLLSCHVPDAARPDGTLDRASARDATVVHFQIGDNFPAFSDSARRAIEEACVDVAFERADLPTDRVD